MFHFGSLSMTAEPAKTTTLKALKHAKSNGLLITFDPNLRESLWNSLADAKEAINEGLAYADILKVSREELVFLTGKEDPGEGTLQLIRAFDIPLIFVTLGERGCFTATCMRLARCQPTRFTWSIRLERAMPFSARQSAKSWKSPAALKG
ncbi:PfkB family carbohydrate kinase [Paenibacillus sp. GM2FR]|uniref:PfkB family carbohydrate kinase n=1 Tax=Paenibacillus sp. GM2FR TaxID=2059268 RepID=UPI0013FE48AA|nr:PfkB family carbohydrate kinase [Paenibacillus sp. GM2FR]